MVRGMPRGVRPIPPLKKKPSHPMDREGQEFLKIVTVDMMRHG
jgi:hypothetical protein